MDSLVRAMKQAQRYGELYLHISFAQGYVRLTRRAKYNTDDELAYWDKAEFAEDSELLGNIIATAVSHDAKIRYEETVP